MGPMKTTTTAMMTMMWSDASHDGKSKIKSLEWSQGRVVGCARCACIVVHTLIRAIAVYSSWCSSLHLANSKDEHKWVKVSRVINLFRFYWTSSSARLRRSNWRKLWRRHERKICCAITCVISMRECVIGFVQSWMKNRIHKNLKCRCWPRSNEYKLAIVRPLIFPKKIVSLSASSSQPYVIIILYWEICLCALAVIHHFQIGKKVRRKRREGSERTAYYEKV